MEKINLSNLLNCAAEEQFQEALKEVIKNIIDPNKDDSIREINIKMKMKTNKNDSKVIDVDVLTKTKLAPDKGLNSRMYVGKKDGQHVAFEEHVDQKSFLNMNYHLLKYQMIPVQL